jgi:succinoglycan biosynthesis transport protein ExoP
MSSKDTASPVQTFETGKNSARLTDRKPCLRMVNTIQTCRRFGTSMRMERDMSKTGLEREPVGRYQPGFDSDERSRGVVGLGEVLLALRKRTGMILAISLVTCLAAVAFVLLATPRFASEAQLLLENRDTAFTRTLVDRDTSGGPIDEQAVRSQIQLVTSREVARQAIRQLDLVGNAEFDPLVGPMDPITRVRTMLGLASGSFDGREEDRIFENYYRALTVYAVPRSRVIAVEFRSADPELSARAANTIAEVYLEQLEEAQGELARAASSWLGANIGDLRERVAEAEAAVERFRASSRLFLSGGSSNVSSQQLSDLNARLAEARSTMADSEARARLISDMIAEGRAFEIPDVANNDLIGRLIEQRIALRSQMALEMRTLLPSHPRILELRAQLADLDEQITASAERTVRILENDARIAASRVESLEAALDAQMSVVAQANESEVQLRALEREARAEREQLENYLTRYREAIARGSENASLPDARIVSRAVVSNNPVFPRKVPTVLLATFGGFFLAVGGVVVAELAFGGGQPARGGAAASSGARRREIEPGEQVDDAPAWASQPMAGPYVAATLSQDAWRGEVQAPAAEKYRANGITDAGFPEHTAVPEMLPVDEATQVPLQQAAQHHAAPHADEPGLSGPLADRVRRLGEGLRGTLTGRDEASAPAAKVDEGRVEQTSIEESLSEEDLITNDANKPVPETEPMQAQSNAGVDTASSDTLASEADSSKEPEAVTVPTPPLTHKPRIRARAATRARQAKQAEPVKDEAPAPPAPKVSPESSSEGGYRFEALLARLRENREGEKGLRVLVSGLGDAAKLREFADSLATAIGNGERSIVIAMQPNGKRGAFPGITDLIAEKASFFDVIQRDPEAAFHRVGFGKGDEEVILEDPDALEITLTAFQHSYDWVFLLMSDPHAERLLGCVAAATDSVVLAADRAHDDPALVSLYERAREAGTRTVLIASVGAISNVAAA